MAIGDKKCKITVLRREYYQDLADEYLRNPAAGKCSRFYDGQEFIIDLQNVHTMADGQFGCAAAWQCIIQHIYDAIWHGNFSYPGWSRDENVLITCCNDGARPVIFKMELID